MYEQSLPKLLLIVLAICLVIFSPLLIVFTPLFFPITFFYEKYTWVYYTPSYNYLLYGIALALIVLICGLLVITNFKKWAIASSIIIGICVLVLLIGASFSYMKLTPNGMKFRKLYQLEEQVYKWSEIEKVDYYQIGPNDSGRSHFEVYFLDGEMYSFKQTSHVDIAFSSIRTMLNQYQIPLTYHTNPTE